MFSRLTWSSRQVPPLLLALVLAIAALVMSCSKVPDREEPPPVPPEDSELVMTVTPLSENVTDGGQGEIDVQFSRPSTVTGPISVSLVDRLDEDLVTATVLADSSTADIVFGIPLDMPLGNNTVTVKASAQGSAPVSKSFTLAVGAKVGTSITGHNTSIRRSLVWMGSMELGRRWVQRQIVNQSYSFAMGGTGGTIVIVWKDLATGDLETQFIRDTPDSLAAEASEACDDSTAGSDVPVVLRNGDLANEFYFAAGFSRKDAPGPLISHADVFDTLRRVRSGMHDFWAARRSSVIGLALDAVWIRNVTFPSSGNLIADFLGSNRISLSTGAVFVNDILGMQTTVSSSFLTGNGTLGPIMKTPAGLGPTFPVNGVPPSLVPTDALHVIEAMATDNTGTRKTTVYSHLLGSGMTTDLPPSVMTAPSCLPTSGSAARLGVTGTTAAGLDQTLSLDLQQTATVKHSVRTRIGATFLHAGGSYDVEMDDLPGLNLNYDPAWSLQRGIPIAGTYRVSGSNLPGGATSKTVVDGQVVSESRYTFTIQCSY